MTKHAARIPALLVALTAGAVACTLGPPTTYQVRTTPAQQRQGATCAPADPNAARFERALCLCGSFSDVGSALVSGSFSSFGTDAASSHLGDVGINGGFDSVGDIEIDGTLDIVSAGIGVGEYLVQRDLLVGSDLDMVSDLTVGGDLAVGGDLSGVGTLDVGGALRVAGTMDFLGEVTCGDVQLGTPFAAHTPCACADSEILDVAAEVAAHRVAEPLPLPDGVGEAVVTLTEGAYYSADGSSFVGDVHFLVEGAVQLYVEDDIDLVGGGMIELAEDAELDLYVAGSLRSVGLLETSAAPSASRALRIYVGGAESMEIDMVGDASLRAAIYAPRADISFVGDLTVEGSLFAGDIDGVGELSVLFDAGLIGLGEACAEDSASAAPEPEQETPAEPEPEEEGGEGTCELENGCY